MAVTLNLTQRSFVSSPKVDGGNRYTGKVVVDIRVDKDGNVIQATAGARGTTITDAALLQKCEDAVKDHVSPFRNRSRKPKRDFNICV
jgi:hypothetical protein